MSKIGCFGSAFLLRSSAELCFPGGSCIFPSPSSLCSPRSFCSDLQRKSELRGLVQSLHFRQAVPRGRGSQVSKALPRARERGSAVKRTGSSSVDQVQFPAPCGSSQLSVTLAPGGLVPFSGICKRKACKRQSTYTYIT